MSLPEGWFPDPSDHAREMRWDGQAWTGETRIRSIASASSDANSPDDEASPLVAAGAPAEPKAPSSGKGPWYRKRAYLIAGIVVAALLIAGGITIGVSVKANHDHQVAVAAAKAAAEKRAEEKAAAKKAAETAERAQRKVEVTAIEASVKKLAQDDVDKQLIDGPVLRATCDPVSGSTDDLTDLTTTFNCFVATKDNGDGTSTGYYFNATMNWDSGSYTYGLGKAN